MRSVLADPKHVATGTVSCKAISQLSEHLVGFRGHSGSYRRQATPSPDAWILTRTSLGPPSLKTHILAPRRPFWLIQSMCHMKLCRIRLYLNFQSLSACRYLLLLASPPHYTVTMFTRTSLRPPFLSPIALWYRYATFKAWETCHWVLRTSIRTLRGHGWVLLTQLHRPWPHVVVTENALGPQFPEVAHLGPTISIVIHQK